MLRTCRCSSGWSPISFRPVVDSALAFDPLSGLGIYKTIESGLRSSAAIVRCFEGDGSGMVEYENWTVEGFRSYLSMRQQFYGSVQRWPESPFWQRRALLKTPPTQAKSIGGGLHLAGEKESGTEKRR